MLQTNYSPYQRLLLILRVFTLSVRAEKADPRAAALTNPAEVG